MSAEPTPAGSQGAIKWVIWGFALLGVLAAGAVIFIAAILFGVTQHERRNDAPVADKAAATKYSVQEVGDIGGTDLIRIEIGIGRRGVAYSSGSGGDVDLRNLILLDKRNGASRKLLANNDRRIERDWLLPAVAGYRPEQQREYRVGDEDQTPPPPPPPAYYVLAVRQAQGLQQDLLVGDLASGRQAFVLSGIDGVDKIWMLSPTQIALLLREKFQLHYRVIDIPTLKVVTARPVDIG